MNIKLIKASVEDAKEIHEMQLISFKSLLVKYQDYDISPGAETIEKIIMRLNQSFSHYYIIKRDETSIGAIRIILKENGRRCRISPIFILPEYQNKGIAQIVFKKIEEMYKPENGWVLDTILEETGNCYLYEKIGYKKTGKIKKIKENMNIVYYEKAGLTTGSSGLAAENESN
jgi:GNAT superfamily N-acetyltransferase